MSEYIYTTEGTFGLRECTGEEIVRCRDCKYYTDDEVEYRHYCNEWCGQVKPDGFCSWGERSKE